MYFDWNDDKNQWLKANRNICFEEVEQAIEAGHLLDRRQHHNPTKYPNQEIFIVWLKEYTYAIPFVRDKDRIFLKTIFASRKDYKKYKQEEQK